MYSGVSFFFPPLVRNCVCMYKKHVLIISCMWSVTDCLLTAKLIQSCCYKETGMISKMVVGCDCDDFIMKKSIKLGKINIEHII